MQAIQNFTFTSDHVLKNQNVDRLSHTFLLFLLVGYNSIYCNVTDNNFFVYHIENNPTIKTPVQNKEQIGGTTIHIWHRHCPSPWVYNNCFSNWHSNFVLMIHGDQRQHSQFWQIFILGQNSVKLLASYKFNLTRRTMTLPVCQMQLLCTLMNWNCFILQNWGKQWRELYGNEKWPKYSQMLQFLY